MNVWMGEETKTTSWGRREHIYINMILTKWHLLVVRILSMSLLEDTFEVRRLRIHVDELQPWKGYSAPSSTWFSLALRKISQ